MHRFIEWDAAIEGSPGKNPLKTARRRSGKRRFVLELLEGRALLTTFSSYPVPSTALPPSNIAVGPEGDLWFTDPGSPGQFGSVTTGGAVTMHPLPAGKFGLQDGPYQITAGGDGASLWMGMDTVIAVATVSASGGVTFTSDSIPNVTGNTLLGRQIGSLTLGPYNNVWFTGTTDAGASFIGEITPLGKVYEFTKNLQAPGNITDGPNGNIWYLYSSGDGIGEVTPTGPTTASITGYTFPNSGTNVNRSLHAIAAGPGGDVWFTETVTNNGIAQFEIGKITPSGTITEYAQPTGGTDPLTSGGGLTEGSDGNLYVAESGTDQIGQVIPSTPPTFNQFPNPDTSAINAGGALDITQGPDGKIWYTQSSPQAVVKLAIGAGTPSPSPTSSPIATPTPVVVPIITQPTTTFTTPTPTPTASAPTGFAPPRINTATTIHKRGRINAVQLLFEPSDPDTLFPSDPLNVADATNVGSYQLLAMVRQKRSRTIVVQPVPLASATYSHVTIPASATYGPFEEVTLTLSQPIPQSERLQFTAFSSTSAIAGVHGMLLDGDGSGQPGSNYVAYLG